MIIYDVWSFFSFSPDTDMTMYATNIDTSDWAYVNRLKCWTILNHNQVDSSILWHYHRKKMRWNDIIFIVPANQPTNRCDEYSSRANQTTQHSKQTIIKHRHKIVWNSKIRGRKQAKNDNQKTFWFFQRNEEVYLFQYWLKISYRS